MIDRPNSNQAKYINLAVTQGNINWDLGDILVDEFGKAPPPDTRDGKREAMAVWAADFKEIGLSEHTTAHISTLRVLASKFTTESRDSVLGWTIHRYAGSPEMLAMIKERADTEKIPLTVKLTEQLRKAIEAELKELTIQKAREALSVARFYVKNWNLLELKLGDADKNLFQADVVATIKLFSEFVSGLKPQLKLTSGG
jgi:hypothetical protein